jgi:hypothetical protein
MMLFPIAALLLFTPAPQASLPFPLAAPAGAADRSAELRALPESLIALADSGLERARFEGVSLPGGQEVDLIVERVPLDLSRAEIHVDGALDRAGIDTRLTSLWSGQVDGRPESEVFLGFTPRGSRGWIRLDGEFVHLLAGADEFAGWDQPVHRWAAESELEREGGIVGVCAGGLTIPSGRIRAEDPGPNASPTAAGALECLIAWESDYQLSQHFSDLAAMQDYMSLVLGAVAYRYREQFDVVLTTVYLGFYTDPLDPWLTPDTPLGNTSLMLDEFRAAWMGNIPGGAHLAHFLSGADLGGGIAYLDVLCDSSFGFAVSANLTHFGRLPSSPPMQGPLTWDFVVIAHELGHNFSSPHTFDYNPPIDTCPNPCINQGTVMSYCHTCGAGMSNITTYFHPRVVTVIRNAAEQSCLPDYCDDGGVNYCIGAANSFSAGGAVMSNSGSTSVTANDFVLEVSDAAANKFGQFYYGGAQAQAPFGEGFRCVGSSGTGTFRLNPIGSTDAQGVLSRPVDFDQPPANAGPGEIAPGSTWNFQFWFRDPMGGPSAFNLSDGLSVSFCP